MNTYPFNPVAKDENVPTTVAQDLAQQILNEATQRGQADAALNEQIAALNPSSIANEAAAIVAADQTVIDTIAESVTTQFTTLVTNEATARGAADTAETAAREAADANITTAVQNEASTRGAADTALQGNIEAEATTRAAADTSEADTRAAADTALDTRVTALEQSGGGGAVSSVNTKTGDVVLTGEDIAVSTTDATKVNAAFSALATRVTDLENSGGGGGTTVPAIFLHRFELSKITVSQKSVSNDATYAYSNTDQYIAPSRFTEAIANLGLTAPTGYHLAFKFGSIWGLPTASSIWELTTIFGGVSGVTLVCSNYYADTENMFTTSTFHTFSELTALTSPSRYAFTDTAHNLTGATASIAKLSSYIDTYFIPD